MLFNKILRGVPTRRKIHFPKKPKPGKRQWPLIPQDPHQSTRNYSLTASGSKRACLLRACYVQKKLPGCYRNINTESGSTRRR